MGAGGGALDDLPFEPEHRANARPQAVVTRMKPARAASARLALQLFRFRAASTQLRADDAAPKWPIPSG